ncbi:MAG TPA: class I tRNA ligase family protein, partial [Ktedonobacterales bacterium]|nr:class I tRNA ligase family protein [Ktedonobacterales bacterium]
NNQGIEGVSRYLGRLWTLVTQTEHLRGKSSRAGNGEASDLTRLRHKIVKRMTEHYDHLRFNTAIAAAMEMTNALTVARDSGEAEADPAAFDDAITALIQMLAPLAPHVTEELWHRRGHKTSIHDSDWPVYDEALTVDAIITIPVQVNGKLRGTVQVPAGSGETDVRTAAESDTKVAAYVAGKPIRNIVFVPDKLINFVVG